MCSFSSSAMRLHRVLRLILVCSCALAEDDGSKVVSTAQGPVRGHRTPEGDLFVFYNIPYATAPEGKDKFKAPLPPPVWTDIRDAVDEKVVCPQADTLQTLSNKNVKPDCLIANIYVPDTEKKNLPVVVVIHGGAYLLGYGEYATSKQLVRSKEVIVVNFNYRLGAHGFLCLGTPDVPGNAGMKDMVALLRWVNRNIASFGGNPNDVTLEGYSAGSSAIDLLILSKSARGLFHKAIPESGASLAGWSVQIDPIANAKEFASTIINYDKVDDLEALEEYYKTIPYELLTKDFFYTRTKNDFIFAPCVERDTGVEMFLDDAPANILKSGNFSKVPMLFGFANMEGLFRVFTNYEGFKKGMNEKFSDFLPHDLQFESEEEKEKVANRVRQFYFKDPNGETILGGVPAIRGEAAIGGETILGFIDYFTDVYFAYPTLRSVTLQVKAGNDKIFLYQFAFADADVVLPSGSVPRKTRGADHCAQTTTVMDGPGDESLLSEDTKKMKAITREMWLNFVTTGSPVTARSSLPAWPPADAMRSPHMSLSLPPELRGPLLPARAQLWDDIYDKYYRAPAPPTPRSD